MEDGYNPVQGSGCVMLRKVRLYGELAKVVGRRVLEAELSSAAEAVRMLIANFPQLERHMADRHYKVLVGDGALTLDDLHYPVGQEEIKIVPVIVGAGGNGVLTALLGAALIATAVFTGGTSLAFGATGFGLASGVTATTGLSFAIAAGNIGVALLLGGVAQMLTPTPEIAQGPDTQQDPRKSFSFSGIQNTSRGGTPVPIVYGKSLTGSVVVSAGIDTEQVQA